MKSSFVSWLVHATKARRNVIAVVATVAIGTGFTLAVAGRDKPRSEVEVITAVAAKTAELIGILEAERSAAKEAHGERTAAVMDAFEATVAKTDATLQELRGLLHSIADRDVLLRTGDPLSEAFKLLAQREVQRDAVRRGHSSEEKITGYYDRVLESLAGALKVSQGK